MLKIFSVIIAIRDLLKYLYQLVGLARGMVEQNKEKKLEKAVDDLKKAETPEDKKDALRAIADNSL